jgi:hypothetical protein
MSGPQYDPVVDHPVLSGHVITCFLSLLETRLVSSFGSARAVWSEASLQRHTAEVGENDLYCPGCCTGPRLRRVDRAPLNVGVGKTLVAQPDQQQSPGVHERNQAAPVGNAALNESRSVQEKLA